MEVYEHFRTVPNGQPDKRHAVVRLIQSPEVELQDRIIKATNSQTKIPPQYLWATDELQRDIEQVFRASGMHYDRRKNSWRKLHISLDKVVGMTELAQAVAAIYLQEPNHARGRPSRYFKKDQYGKVFKPKLPMDLYIICASLRKKGEVFLRQAEQDRKHRNNLLFYLLMAVVCVELKTPRPQPTAIATSPRLRELKDESFISALTIVRPIYEKYGASDNAAKGPEMVADLKSTLVERFAKQKGKKASPLKDSGAHA